MRIAIISHSSVHLRQQLFYKELEKHAKIYAPQPERWINLKGTKDTIPVHNEGDINRYYFDRIIAHRLVSFDPDIIYCQNEPYSYQAILCHYYAKLCDSKLVIFTWENQKDFEYQFDLDAVVCGNKEAYELCNHPSKVVIPQVGIDTDLFKPMNIKKEHDFVFVGRRVSEKGYHYVKEKCYCVSNKDYKDMPKEYNKAKVLLVPSLTTPHWAEQMPYNIAEALSCGLYVVAFDSGSIRSNYEESNINLCKEKNIRCMWKQAEELANNFTLNKRGRDWVVRRLSKEVIAKRLIKFLEDL